MHLLILAVLLSAALTSAAPAAQQMNVQYLPWKAGLLSLNVAVGVMEAQGPTIADVLYIHGYGDCFSNHHPLFQQWSAVGFRVIAFDLPQHGLNSGLGNHLDLFGFESLAKLAGGVEKLTNEDSSRALYISGWSTGGLVAVRILQQFSSYISRPISGSVLFAPGVDVYALVGDWGRITQETLTNNPNPPHICSISPNSPLKTPVFAAKLLLNSKVSNSQALPRSAPTLVLIAGEKTDKYCDSKGLREWAQHQAFKHARITAVQCRDAKHELDNEPFPVGPYVRRAATEFFRSLSVGINYIPPASDTCTQIR